MLIIELYWKLIHSLTLLEDGRIKLFGGKERRDLESCSSSKMYRDRTPQGIFTLNREDLSWTVATVEGDKPDGRAYHITMLIGYRSQGVLIY